MSITLNCPRCKAHLSFPNDEGGQYGFCQKCDGRVWVPQASGADPTQAQPVAAAASAESGTTAQPVAKKPKDTSRKKEKRTAATPPPAADPMAPVDSSGDAAPNSAPQPPAAASQSATPPPPPGSDSKPAKGSSPPPSTPSSSPTTPSGRSPPGVPPKPPEAENPMAPVAPSVPAQAPQQPMQPAAQPGTALQTPARRVATFITADVAQSDLELAGDGKLPELELSEQDKKAKKKASPAAVQWRVVALVCGSLTLSALMMFGDFDASGPETTPADGARKEIKERYIGEEGEPLESYQLYLREALIAHSRGDYSSEKRNYRRVWYLLRDERLDRDPDGKGLTGIRVAPDDKSLPNDERLEFLLSILLKT